MATRIQTNLLGVRVRFLQEQPFSRPDLRDAAGLEGEVVNVYTVKDSAYPMYTVNVNGTLVAASGARFRVIVPGDVMEGGAS